MGKESACNSGDLGSIPGSGRSPGEEKGNPLWYSCLENPMDGEGWWAAVHGVAKSRTLLSLKSSDAVLVLVLKVGEMKILEGDSSPLMDWFSSQLDFLIGRGCSPGQHVRSMA